MTPLDELVEHVAAGTLQVQVGRIFKLDDIVEAHRSMEENKAGGKIVLNDLRDGPPASRYPAKTTGDRPA